MLPPDTYVHTPTYMLPPDTYVHTPHSHATPDMYVHTPTAMLPPGVMEAHHAKLSFFKASVCETMLERLVGHYLLLSEEELENWNTNIEEFCECSAK